MNRRNPLPNPAVRRTRRNRARTLVEMMIALAVFATATLGIWECIRTVFFLSAKNTGLNLSHTALELGMDRLSEQLRGSLQIIDVATFDGANFTHVDETAITSSTPPRNAVRFLRLIPITLYLLPDDGAKYSMTTPEDPSSLLYPDYLTSGKKTATGTFTTAVSLTDPGIVADLVNARICPRFPYVRELFPTGSNQGTTYAMPGLDLTTTPTFAGTTTNGTTGITSGNISLTLVNGWPSATIPSCNQAYLVIISAAVVINRGTSYAELIYYPDATNLARSTSLTTALAPSSSGVGPTVFALPVTAGALTDPTARGSLQVTLPVYAPNLGGSVVRRGGTAALVNVEVNLPVETRRLAFF